MFRFILLSAAVAVAAAYHDPNYAPGHNSMVHLFEWKWDDIADECERFLGPKLFGGVQVSPPNENLAVTSRNRPWWERYQPISYRLETRSGNEQQFTDMVRRCNAAGVRIFVDAIINHMTGTWPENVGTGGSTATFSTWDYPSVPYTSADFNWPPCLINDGDYTCCADRVRNCELVELKDLNQTNENVRNQLTGYMNKLIDLGVAGFRIDAAKHMWPSDLQAIYNRLNDLPTSHGFAPNTRPYIFQEVIDLGGESISAVEYIALGAVTEFRSGMELSRCFAGQNQLKWLENYGVGWGLMDSGVAVDFIDNHDTQRGHGPGGVILNYKSGKQYRAAVAFMLAHPHGEAQLMSSYDFWDSEAGPPTDASFNTNSVVINADGSCGNGWICEHRWRAIYGMVGFRSAVEGTELSGWWDNDNNQIAFCRGDRGFVAFNIDWSELRQSLQTCLPAGTYCDVISGELSGDSCTGKSVEVDEAGFGTIVLGTNEDDSVFAIHAWSRIGGEGPPSGGGGSVGGGGGGAVGGGDQGGSEVGSGGSGGGGTIDVSILGDGEQLRIVEYLTSRREVLITRENIQD